MEDSNASFLGAVVETPPSEATTTPSGNMITAIKPANDKMTLENYQQQAGTAAPADMPLGGNPTPPAINSESGWLTAEVRAKTWFWKEMVLGLAMFVFFLIQIFRKRKTSA